MLEKHICMYVYTGIHRYISQLLVEKFAFLAKVQHGETFLSPSSNAKMSTQSISV